MLLQPRRFHPAKAAWVLFVLLLFTVYTTRRDRAAAPMRWGGPAMGSTYAVQIADRGGTPERQASLRSDVEALLEEINAETSTWLTNSAVSRFNAATSTAPFEVSADLAGVTRLTLAISRLSGGAFDVTLSPLFDLWGFGPAGPRRAPTEGEVARTLERCGHRHLAVDASDRLRKAVPGLQVTYNAVIPGHAAERIAQLLAGRGCTNIYVDVGGETVVRGRNPLGGLWRVGIERPSYDALPGEALAAVVHLTDRAIATSGDYRNYATNDAGEVYSHIFDARTGRPATGRVASVSIIATNGALADALATTLFALGPAEGLPLLTNFPGTEALFLMRNGQGLREEASPGFAAYRSPAPP
jgi:thiamine biosynthesis lipoprotein